MMSMNPRKGWAGYAAGVISGLALAALLGPLAGKLAPGARAEGPEPKKGPVTLESLQAQVDEMKEMLPGQSMAMSDISFQYSNAWFAAQKGNWPLARFYIEETREHLPWAVGIEPTRKNKDGEIVDLKAILKPIDETLLEPLEAAAKAKDAKEFEKLYKLTIERGCYSCHKSVNKPYLRPQIPVAPPRERIINMDPDAKWPE